MNTETSTLTNLVNNYVTVNAPTAILITGPPGSGKTALLREVASTTKLVVRHLHEAALTDPEVTITTLFHSKGVITFDNIDLYCPPTPTLLENRVVAALTYALAYTPALFIATGVTASSIHPAILHRIQHVITLDALSYEERLEASKQFDCAEEIAQLTPGFLWSDMRRLFKHLSTIPPKDVLNTLPSVLHEIRPALLSNQEVVSREHVLYGLNEQIQQLQQTLHAVFSTTETATQRALKNIGNFRGIIVHGATGCGKTTLARMGRQLIKQHTVNFVEISSTQVVGSIVGEGERKLDRLFTIAKAIAPSVIIIDNIDIIAPRRSDEYAGDGVKAFERVLSILLVLIDGIVRDDKKVLVIGTTRNLNLVDGALLRPGRFDLQIRVDPPDTEARLQIMRNFLSSRGMKAADVGVPPNFAQLSKGWTAPDILAYVRRKVLQTKANFI